MCEDPVMNRGNLRTSMSKEEACMQFRDRETPGDCRLCYMLNCDYNSSMRKVKYAGDK